MKRKDMLRQLLAPEGQADTPAVPSAVERRVASGAVRAMGLDLERLTSEARRAEELERRASAGELVVEVDPSLVDPSFAEDRIARTADADYRALVQSIAATGQQVPVLLRPHPGAEGRYQVAYGHRRVAAATELGRPVLAIVRRLSDVELVIAQGKENAERRNLSFIERACFAAELEARGFERATVQAALAAHPAEMTRYLTVARAVPRWVARGIGPAPRIGRPRWMELAELLKAEGGEELARSVTERPDFTAASSDRRFEMLIDALRRMGSLRAGQDTADAILGADGAVVVRLEQMTHGLRLSVVERASPGLSSFLAERIRDLVAEFRSHRDGKPGIDDGA